MDRLGTATAHHAQHELGVTVSYRGLAAAVVLRAIKDAHGQSNDVMGRTRKRKVRDEARRFLSARNPNFAFLCDGLDLDPVALVEAVKTNGPAFARRLAHGQGVTSV